MIDLILQGPLQSYTREVLIHYKETNLFNKIFYCHWTSEDSLNEPGIEEVFCDPPSLAGSGNCNYQIVSSLAGVSKSQATYCLKMRADVLIQKEDLQKFLPYYLGAAAGRVLCLALSRDYSFFSWDFFYFGTQNQVLNLFNSPLQYSENHFPNLQRAIIPETYITAAYIAKTDQRVRDMMDPSCINDFLVQHQPGYAMSRLLSETVLDTYFKPIPDINIRWIKHKEHWTTSRDLMRVCGRHNDTFGDSW